MQFLQAIENMIPEDKIKRKEQTNDINAPDISLIICRDFIVFDKTKNKVFIVVFSDNTKRGYDDSKEKVRSYEKLLVTDLHANDLLSLHK